MNNSQSSQKGSYSVSPSRDIFDFANTLKEQLTEDKTSGLEQARQNSQEVVNALKEIQQEKQK
jgi:hypothetical protein